MEEGGAGGEGGVLGGLQEVECWGGWDVWAWGRGWVWVCNADSSDGAAVETDVGCYSKEPWVIASHGEDEVVEGADGEVCC